MEPTKVVAKELRGFIPAPGTMSLHDLEAIYHFPPFQEQNFHNLLRESLDFNVFDLSAAYGHSSPRRSESCSLVS